MPTKVKDITKSTTKWEDRGRAAASEYSENAAAAAGDWEAKTKQAAGNFKAAIQSAGIELRFAAGVAKAGAAKYARKITEVAGDRFAPGISAATVDYRSGAEPYFAAIAAVSPPPRKPRGDPANIARVEAYTKALNAKRLAMLGMKGA